MESRWVHEEAEDALGRRNFMARRVPSAMFDLGLRYDIGQGVAQDYAKAREWYEKAADKGNAYAMTRLRQMPSPNGSVPE